MNNIFSVRKSQNQRQLEKQGCVFVGQELLGNHELDPEKDCCCGRPNEALEIVPEINQEGRRDAEKVKHRDEYR
jgi:hypothetical protein